MTVRFAFGCLRDVEHVIVAQVAPSQQGGRLVPAFYEVRWPGGSVEGTCTHKHRRRIYAEDCRDHLLGIKR